MPFPPPPSPGMSSPSLSGGPPGGAPPPAPSGDPLSQVGGQETMSPGQIDQQKISVLDNIREIQTACLGLAQGFPMAAEPIMTAIDALMQAQQLIITSLGANAEQPAPDLLTL